MKRAGGREIKRRREKGKGEMEGKTEGLGKKTKGDWKEDRGRRRQLEQRRSASQRIQPLYGHTLVVEEFNAHELKRRFSIAFLGVEK